MEPIFKSREEVFKVADSASHRGIPSEVSEVIIVRLFLQELETRIETQKQTLQARDESIKKLLEMLQSKGDGERE